MDLLTCHRSRYSSIEGAVLEMVDMSGGLTAVILDVTV